MTDADRVRPEQHEPPTAAALRARLRHVYWIGGGSGAGKSTIAGRIAARHGMQLYPTDDVMPDHARRSTPEDSPQLAEFAAMDMDGRWLTRSPQTMLETFHWFRGECFSLIVEDPGHAVWLLPTPEFRRAALARRGSLWQIARKTSDPERALRNLLERDRMFTRRLYRETKRLDLPVIEVDTSMTEAELAGRATAGLGL